MIPFKKCPICGGEVIEKEVKKLLRGGKNTAVVVVKAKSVYIVVKDYIQKRFSAILNRSAQNLNVKKYQILNY